MTRSRRALAATLMMLVVAPLSGCVLAEPEMTASPASDVNDSAAAASPEPTSSTPAAALELFDPSAITDSGPAEGATGVVKQDDAGYWYYEVAEGDVGSLICDRFGRSWWQLERADGPGGYDCHATVYVGDIVIPTDYEKSEMEGANGLPPIPTDNPFES